MSLSWEWLRDYFIPEEKRINSISNVHNSEEISKANEPSPKSDTKELRSKFSFFRHLNRTFEPEIIKYIALVHRLKVEPDKLTDLKYLQRLFNHLKPINQEHQKDVEHFLKLPAPYLTTYETWVKEWEKIDSNSQSQFDKLFDQISNNPGSYSLPLLFIACDYEGIVIKECNVDYLRRILTLNLQEDQTLEHCAQIALRAQSRNELLNFLAVIRTYPQVDWSKVPFEHFRKNKGSEIKSFEDLLAVGWLRDRHLYDKYPLLFYVDPIKDRLQYHPELDQSAYTQREIKELIHQIDPNINSYSFEKLKELVNLKRVYELDAQYYGRTSSFTEELISEQTPGIIWGDQPILLSELSQHFQSSGLVDPWTLAPLTQKQIDQLLPLMDKDLTEFIIHTCKKNIDREIQVSLLIKHYNESKTIELLNYILEAGMIMRGWHPLKPFPLKKTDKKTIDHELKQNYLDLYHEVLMKEFEAHPEVANLPLQLYRFRKFNFSTRVLDGLTLKERFIIVIERVGIESCSRVSSNWFISSAYFYLNLLGATPKFKIEELEMLDD